MVWQKGNNLALLMDIYNASIEFWKKPVENIQNTGNYCQQQPLLNLLQFFFFSVDLLLFFLFFFSSVAYRSR